MASANLVHLQAVGLRDTRGRFALAKAALVAAQLEEGEALSGALTMLFRGRAPKDSGAFAHGISAMLVPSLGTSGFTIAVRTDNENLAKWLREGTGIYGPYQTPVVPVHARFLRWVDAGGVHFARSVRGMRANPWQEEAEKEAMPMATVMVNRVAARVMAVLR